MASVLLAILTATASFDGSSVIITTSAASIAASDPSPPIATPMSALAKTGASLIPSPTKTSFPLGLFSSKSLSTRSTLSLGRSSKCTSSTPSFAATSLAVASWSPVSITVFLIPFSLRLAIAVAASSFISSAISIYPAYPSSIAI